MIHYIQYNYNLLRNFGSPTDSAGAAVGLIWGLDFFFILELLFFDGEYPNPLSVSLAAIVFLIIFLYCRKHSNDKTREKAVPLYYKTVFIIQIMFTIVGVVWFNMHWL